LEEACTFVLLAFIFYLLYHFSTLKSTTFDHITKQELPVLLFHQSAATIEAALKGKVLSDFTMLQM